MRITIIFFLIIVAIRVNGQETFLKTGTIKKSLKFKKDIYKVNGDTAFNKPVIEIEGNNLVVDFNNATLIGSNDKTNPDEFYGAAIYIHKGENITIKNLVCKGFKIAIIADDVKGLIIENCNLSYTYRQHLKSTQQKEDEDDWLTHHHNENNEWQRYGAAIYLSGCTFFTVHNCKANNGQNGLMMTHCTDGMVYNNNFSFNSGLGIGMYRSSKNKILYNKLDFNVRGYSDGVYARGQDSGGILVYEQSNDNVFFKNSVTHSGDGFFLWAGQTTMDTGAGGCNNNLLLDNDFSYAPTNGIEVTFSSNKIVHNRIFECDNGIWGGYSFNTDISENQFRRNKTGIAIEHGQNNVIHQNLFIGDKVAVHLWAKKEEPSDWGYPKYRDTRSKDYVFIANSFNNDQVAYRISNTDSIAVFGDHFSDVAVPFKTDSTVTRIDSTVNDSLWANLSIDTSYKIPEIKNPIDPFIGVGRYQGRKNILMTEWGPYNFEYPMVWNTNPVDPSDTLHFKIYGPKGKWKLVSAKGLDWVQINTQTYPATITALKQKNASGSMELKLSFTGKAFIDAFGYRHIANKPYIFYYKRVR